jgi:5-(carboxyamino)imidazole ribonucleotide synthase
MKTVGIVKGGQLGRMLIQAGMDYGISTHVLDPDPAAPCRNLCDRFVGADPMDEEALVTFGRSVDVLTFEFEHVNVRALERLEAEGKPVFPGSGVMRTALDKGLQKQFFKNNRIPTADFMLVAGRAELERAAALFPCAQKTRTAGYDGHGVQLLDSLADRARAWDVPSVIERRVPFVKEISVIVARDRFGNTAVYPASEMAAHPERHLLDRLICPARVAEPVAGQAAALARKIADALGMVGVIAVEMFVTADGSVLVNEIAPRPHNSGHHTIEANATSQYAQHIRCVLGLPLGATGLVCPAVMINLIGEPGHTGPARYQGIEDAMRSEGVYVHLYGKAETRPYRKMGHVTVTGTSLEAAEEKAGWVRSRIKVLA